MNVLKNMDNCYGCGACFNICPIHAIEMKHNDDGFLEPKIDEKKCIKCNRCRKVCISYTNKANKMDYNPRCFAVSVKDFLEESSSGGLFSLLAEWILEHNGIVCGVEFDDKFNAVYKAAKTCNELEPLKLSKYVQSDTGAIFREVNKELANGKWILFVGCGCQVAGLKSYLGDSYNNLITVDLLCHGAPSPIIFKKHLNSMFGIENIKAVEMRNREGWSSCLHVVLQNGEVFHFNNRREIYGLSFHKDLILRKTCYGCKFSNIQRQGDLTLGDMWEARKLKLGDPFEKKSSVVLLNTSKGSMFFEKIINEAMHDIELIDLTEKGISIDKLNKNITRPSVSREKLKKRNIFYDNYKRLSFEEAAWRTLYPNSIGLLLYMSNNYGSCATNYALYTAVKKLGYTPIVVDNLIEIRGLSKKFAEKHMIMSSKFMEQGDFKSSNQLFETYLVGSDQSYRFDSPFVIKNIEKFLMTFAGREKRKIIYAGSFGPKNYKVDENIKKLFAHGLGEVRAISFREDYAVEMCEKLFSVRSEWVCDPVFLVEKEEWIKLAKESRVSMSEPFLFAYIRFYSESRIELIKRQASKHNLKVVVACDANDHNKLKEKIAMAQIIDPVEFVDWLQYYLNADFVITDSFHGTCFSLIFEKKFIAIKAGTKERFDSLAKLLDCMLSELGIYENIDKIQIKTINYELINRKIEIIKKAGLEWLSKALISESDMDGIKQADVLFQEAKLFKENYYLKKEIHRIKKEILDFARNYE